MRVSKPKRVTFVLLSEDEGWIFDRMEWYE